MPGLLRSGGDDRSLAEGGRRASPAVPPVETVDQRSADPDLPDRAVRGITRPRLVVFRPRIPNGGRRAGDAGRCLYPYRDRQGGYEIARWLSARGYAVFVLFYRLPGDGWKAGPDVALSDAQRAMRLIRSRAQDFAIDPERVAAMGFSAGGHLCCDLATRFAAKTYDPVDAADRLSARPFIAAPIYAVQSMTWPVAHAASREQLIGKDASPALERAHTPAENVTKQTPPCFLLHAEDDPTVPVENSLLFRAALKAQGITVETHLFTNGGHGFGLRKTIGKPVEAWPELFLDWAKTQGFA